MIGMRDVLRAIDRFQDDNPVTDAELSRLATGSPDTIRNWRRAVRAGRDAGAHVHKLQAVGRVIGVDFALEGTQPLLRSDEEILSALERIIGLTENDVTFLMKQIKSAQHSNGVALPQPQSHDLSPSANRPRESTPSE